MPLCINIAKQNGIICTITQNSILCEDTAINNRNYIFDNCKIISFDSFPERDNVKKRVFESAKMSVCISVFKNKASKEFDFNLNIWREKDMLNKNFSKIFKRNYTRSLSKK